MKSSISTSTLAVLTGVSILSQVSAQVLIDWVTIGNIENLAQSSKNRLHTYTGGDGYGAVDYEYRIGKYEVTNAQYTVFLNAVDPSGSNPNGIYDGSMGSNNRGGISFISGAPTGSKYSVKTNMGNKPVNYISWFDAARFTNWLHNGQGSGSTETGAYTLNNATSGIITKNAGATVWLPSENEWYKAAYYDPTMGDRGGYYLHANQSDSVPTSATANTTGDVSNPGANTVNYDYGADWNSLNGNVTSVGSAGASSYYGVFDMAGNVLEWNDAVVTATTRGQRGGSYQDLEIYLRSSYSTSRGPAVDDIDYGFRVASLAVAAVPEPSGLVLTMLIGAGFVCHRRRSL
jgi:formylglycine-generating enzyme required for sulfatase activity